MIKEFEKLFAHMEYQTVPEEIRESISMNHMNSTMRELMNKSNSSFWVQMNSNYFINKLSSMLTILYIAVEHKPNGNTHTFSCIDSKKSILYTYGFKTDGYYVFEIAST